MAFAKARINLICKHNVSAPGVGLAHRESSSHSDLGLCLHCVCLLLLLLLHPPPLPLLLLLLLLLLQLLHAADMNICPSENKLDLC
jgi:hypothetical protein